MMPSEPLSDDALKAEVRAKYGQIAAAAKPCCCSGGAAFDVSEDYTALDGYVSDADLSLGCGLPTEHAGLRSGDSVLDLGSGAGNDAFIARARVGDEGQVIGVDMTDEMIALARRNARLLGYENVTFRKGEIEALPVEDASVDVIISNCVLNLVPDKVRAFAEMRRVLRPGGRFCVSDIVTTGALPPAVRRAAALYAGCVSGALEQDAYLALLADAGFRDVQVVKERPLDVPDEALAEAGPGAVAEFRASGTALRSITVVGHVA